uniref:Run domain Beclin-1-interacting and cysteine-rich domain-containing protein n=1 Tax=Cacopsylla melanoneura TaxID=428564 RepID=A0A8D8VS84_9HEMI
MEEDEECCQLLSQLKSTVELIVGTHAETTSDKSQETLGQLYTVVESIFKHKCQVFDGHGEPDIWSFVQGLTWLQPSLAIESIEQRFSSSAIQKKSRSGRDKKSSHSSEKISSSDQVRNSSLANKSSSAVKKENSCSSCKEISSCSRQSDDVYTPWLYKCLEDRNLSDRLSWLLSDPDHVSRFYSSKAFLSRPTHTEAAILCLMAFEQNLLPLLTIINPKLYAETWRRRNRSNQKSVSYPESIARQPSLHIKPWASVPELSPKMKPAYSPSVLHVDYRKTTSPSQHDVPEAVDALGYFLNHSTPPVSHRSNSILEGEGCQSPSESTSHKYYNINITSCVKRKAKSFMQDGGNSILPMTLGCYPKPAKGESLLSFLASSQYSRSNAELDRENSHFYIAEAVICVIEQVKWEMELQKLRDAENRLNLRETEDTANSNRETETETRYETPVIAVEAVEDDRLSRSDSVTTLHSTQDSQQSSSPFYSARNSLSLDENEDSSTLMHSLCSDSMTSLSIDSISKHTLRDSPSPPASLYNSNLNSSEATSSSSSLSAEGVALSLLRKFSDQQLPAASDFDWLGSDKEISPPELSPLSYSCPMNLDQMESNNSSTLLRGTYEWAPPRPQIIFFAHPTPVRHAVMMKQNLRCAGCGMRVALQYASKFRYCAYLGRYFCTGCHSNDTALIPGKILHAWNFKKYPVSKFSLELLDSMMSDPLFRISDINSALFKKVQVLGRVKKLRHQLNSLKDFLLSCRFAESMRAVLLGQEPHLLMDPEVYSMQDLIDVKTGALYLKLKDLVSACSSHVTQCQLCLARGFICELCQSEEVIFPWQLSSVHRCTQCGACYHSKCYHSTGTPCMRCVRIKIRRDSVVNSDHGLHPVYHREYG